MCKKVDQMKKYGVLETRVSNIARVLFGYEKRRVKRKYWYESKEDRDKAIATLYKKENEYLVKQKSVRFEPIQR